MVDLEEIEAEELRREEKSDSISNYLAFMTITMQDLRDDIIRDGTTVEYKNGENQYGTKQSPDAQLYLQLSQKQTQAMKILLDCLPKDKKLEIKAQEDDFDEFVDGRDEI